RQEAKRLRQRDRAACGGGVYQGLFGDNGMNSLHHCKQKPNWSEAVSVHDQCLAELTDQFAEMPQEAVDAFASLVNNEAKFAEAVASYPGFSGMVRALVMMGLERVIEAIYTRNEESTHG